MKKTNSQASLAKSVSNHKKAVIIPIILVVLVGHFIIQMSFIESVKVEPLTKAEPLVETEIIPQIILSNQSQIKENKGDVALSDKPLEAPKEVQTVKIAQRETPRQIQNTPVQAPLKKEVKRDVKAERLRRAEKILTGF